MPRRFAGKPARYSVMLGVTLAVCLGASACSSSGGSNAGDAAASPASKTDFTVLGVTAQSGAFSAYGAADDASLKAAAAYLNASGGILGHKVEIVTENDNSVPATAVSLVQEYLSNHPAPNDVYPGSESTETQALFPLLAQKNLLAVAGSSGFTELETGKYPDIFSSLGPPGQSLDALVANLKNSGYKSVGMLVEGLEFTEGEVPTLTADLKKAGISYHVADFQPTALDLTPEMSQLKANSPDALVVLAISASAGYALKARAQLNWNVPVVGDVAFGDTNLVSLVPASDLKGVQAVIYGSSKYLTPSEYPPGLTTFLKYMQPYMNSTISSLPMVTPGRAWDGLMAIAAAAKQANSIDPAAIAKALENFSDTSDPNFVVFPKIGFTPSYHEDTLTTIADYPVVQVGSIVGGMLKPAG
jgi:branched-chain amino acid transport system substrate-binding protein